MNAIIFHGTGDSPESYWFPYMTNILKNKGYDVWIPQLPNADCPNLNEWLPYILENGNFASDTVLIGHSSGAQIILSLLEKNEFVVKQAILVSGYSKALRQDALSENNAVDFDWNAIRGKAKEFIFINSDNDPWGYDDKQGRIMFNNLGGSLIVRHDGHMGSTSNNQPYREFPLLARLVI